ncbi:hypothetical protein [Streptomyces sp. GS7]|uniref:hypothetical protein n=1 Tax=Streptomyces sp. GS7 TaxID=2692234 RepID=UPI001316562A|nr:hypothetical protein [Streptomyces sp. GS7]QHC20362.1 hypothetical protein GR130_01835 [Streptomyces sp. GS7]
MKTTRISPASRISLRAICTAALLAGAMAVPAAAFAGTPGQQERPASTGAAHSAPQAPAKGKVRAVDIGGGMEAVIHNGVCDLQAIGSGRPFATLRKGQSYTNGIHVYFDGRNVSARSQGERTHGKVKPNPARTVRLSNGAQATVQKVNGSYTAKIQVRNKRIATLDSAHRSVTHQGVRYTVNPKDGKVAVQRMKKRQMLHRMTHRVIHVRAHHLQRPHFQRPVTSYAQTPAASPAQPTANYATYASPAQQPVTGQTPFGGQAQTPMYGQAQTPMVGQAQTPMYGGGWMHRSRHGASAGAMAMSYSAAGSSSGR